MNQRLDGGDSTIGWKAFFVVFCIILAYGCEFFYLVLLTYKKEWFNPSKLHDALTSSIVAE